MRKALLLFSALLVVLASPLIPHTASAPNNPPPSAVAQDAIPRQLSLEKEILLAPGEHVAIYYDEGRQSLVMNCVLNIPLPPRALDALERAPGWLKWRLNKTFQDMMVVEIDNRITGSKSGKPALVDFDGDGKLDLLLGLHSGTVLFYRNIGTSCRPLFEEEHDLFEDIEVDSYAAPAPVDLNGDGLIDIAVGREDGLIDFWWNVGTKERPEWEKASSLFRGIDVGRHATPFFVDYDGDGLMDLVVGSRSGKIYFFKNVGTPDSPVWVEYEEVFAGIDVGMHVAPVLAHLGGGEAWWLILGASDGNIYIFKNEGGLFEPNWVEVENATVDLDVGESSAPAVGDLNGDGKLDLVISNSYTDVFFAENEGTPDSPLFVSRASNYEEVFVNAGEFILKPPFILIHDPVFWFKWYLDVWYAVHYGGLDRVWPGYYTLLDKLRVYREHYEEYVNFMANFLLRVPDPYVDEIAYWMAHEYPGVLRAIAYYAIYEDKDITEDYVLNVQSIYETADLLPYIQIVEHPDEGYTTVAYRREDNSWIEVDRYIYYQFLMMPTKNTLSPGLRLNDYYGGHFFRTWLLYDEKYGICLFDLVKNATTPVEAAHRIHWWSWYVIRARWDNRGSWRARGWWQIWNNLNDIRDDSVIVMCGEFATITECWLKAALIPAVESSNQGEDHVWVEFYGQDGSWHHMDTTGPPESYLENPRLYEEGWRKNVSAVFWSDHAGRYDHPVLSPLPYTYKARVVFQVVDENGVPIDGARVEAWSHWLIRSYGFAFPSFYNYTDENGVATLLLGHNNYTFVVVSRYGYKLLGWPYPNGLTVRENRTYYFPVVVPRARAPLPSVSEEGMPDVLSPHHISVSISLLEAYQYAPSFYGIEQYYRYEDVWQMNVENGSYLDVFLMSRENYSAFLAGRGASAYRVFERTNKVSISELPVDEDLLKSLVVVVSNEHSVATYKRVLINITFTYDDKPPTVVIHEPKDGEIIDGDTITVVFSSPDDDIHHFEISVDDGPWLEASSPYTITGLEKGPHTIRVRAVDISGLMGEASVSVILDGEYLRSKQLAQIALYGGIAGGAAAASVVAVLIIRKKRS